MADVSKEEQVGFHKGALATLLKERQELARMLTIVDQLIQAHAKALEQLGVKPAEEEKEEKKRDSFDQLLK